MLPVISEHHLVGHGGHPVFHRRIVPDDPVASVVLLHGYAEHSGRYVHVLRALAARGLAVLAPDHRGHGRTARVLGDVEDVEHILSDLAVVHREALRVAPGRPVFLLGHSFGGLLTLRYLQRHGAGVCGAVVNAPALKAPSSIRRRSVLAARVVGRVWPTLPIQGFFDPTRACRDVAVHELMRADPLQYRGAIRARTGMQVMRTMRSTLAELPRVRVPVLLTHGERDRTVPVDVSRVVWHGIQHPDKTLTIFPELLHEVHQEPERDEVIATWTEWISSRAVSAHAPAAARRTPA